MAQQQFEHLTLEQVDFFMENGAVAVKNGFTKMKAAEWTENIWHKRENVASFAPKVWEVMKEPLGGEERIDQPSGSWGDSFIVNLGTEALEKADAIDPKDLDNWHVDGDFFVHYLDSREQASLVIPIFSDVKPRGGTFVAPEGIDNVAKYLAAHPEGVLLTGMSFTPSTSTSADPKDGPGYYSHLQEVRKCTKFFEITGEVGDVIPLHPLTLHSASKNHLRVPRFITNPLVSLREPFNFNRENPNDLSLVEKNTLKALSVHRLDYKITTERKRIVPRSRAAKYKLKLEERRLADFAAKKRLCGISPLPPPISVA